MDWDQIEHKWAAMTRRIRADWSADKVDAKALSGRRASRTDSKPGLSLDPQPSIVDARQRLSTK